MIENKEKKSYDLEERTLKFALNAIRLCKVLPYNVINKKLVGQLVSADGSVGANYREANEALSKKDFVHKMKITRKEAKESSYWPKLLKEPNPHYVEEINVLYRESLELRNIFSSILEKTNTKKYDLQK
jgi:four helix bundle protein